MATKVINSLTFGDTYVFTTPYATSSTAAGTAAKVASCTPNSNFVLETGARVSVLFSAANSVSSPTLNVNSTGAKTIRFRGAALSSSLYYWAANSVVDFVYDGTYWNMVGAPNNTNSTYSVNNATITLSAGTGLSGGGDFTTNQSSAETIEYSLEASGVTAGTYGPSANVTGTNNTTMSVPQITVDTYGRITSIVNRTYTAKDTDTNTHPTVVNSAPTLSWGTTSTIGTIGGTALTVTMPANPDTDTNTDKKTSSGNTSSKIYLVGATSQSSSGVTTYSHDTAYVGTDGCLYSNSTKVSVEGHTHTFTDTNTAHTHSAGTGISLSGSGGTSGTTTISLATSGVTATSYGPSANASPAHSGTFSVPYITVDAYGRITAASTKTITLPASGNTDTYGRNANTTSKIYLMGGTTQSASNKTTYSNVKCYASGGYLYSNGTKVSVEGHTHNITWNAF